jgi:DNA-binding transcriptional LysR family regulator
VPNCTLRVTNRLILRDFHNHESRSNGVNFPTFQVVDSACLREVIHWKPLLLAGFGKHPYIGDLVSEGIDLAIRFGQPRRSTLVSRKLIEAPIFTVASPRYLKRYGKPEHPSALTRHRCLQFVDPYTGRPFGWEFVSKEETIEVATGGPLIFSDPKSMLQECLAGTGVPQIIGWGIKDLLARGVLIDLFPAWNGQRFPLLDFHPSRKHPRAKVRAFVDFSIKVIQEL